MKLIREAITEHPFFLGMQPEQLEVLVSCASEVKFKANQILFREGEPANRFYLLQSGRVAIEAGETASGTALVQELGPGEVIGWSWLFPPFTWHFQARALEPSRAIVLDGGHLLATAESDHAFGFELMKRVARVLIHRLQAARKQLLAHQIESAMDG